MKLNKIFPNFDSFNNKVLTNLKTLFPNSEWLNESNSFMSFQTLFGMLDLYYGDYDIRYDSEGTFIRKFIFDLSDLLPDIYSKQQAFIKNQLGQYLSEARNRAIKIEGGSQSNRDQNSGTKSGTSTTPVNMVVTEATDIANIPLSSANVQNLKFVENYNQSNEQTNFRFIDDLIKQLNSDYSLRLKEFMNMLNKHFRFIVSSKERDVTSLYDGVHFRNGYYVPDVDYLGIENREQITLTNGKVQTNRNDIDTLKSQIGSIPNEIKDINEKLKLKADLTNTNQTITTKYLVLDNSNKPTINNGFSYTGDYGGFLELRFNGYRLTTDSSLENNYLKPIKDEQQIQNQNIDKNTNSINQLIEQLKQSTFLNYKGEWVEGTTAKIGEVYSYDNKLWIVKVESTTTSPADNDIWDLISAPEINLDNYYTMSQMDEKFADTNNEITTIKNDLGDLGDQVQGIQGQQNINTNDINNIKSNYVSQNKAMNLISLSRSGSSFVLNKETMTATCDTLGSINFTSYYQSNSYLNRYPDLPKGVESNGAGLLVHVNFTPDRALQLWYARENSQNYYQRHKIGTNSWTNWTKFSGVSE